MKRPTDPRDQARVEAIDAPYGAGLSIEINKCLKNTYMLLGMALLFSGAVAYFTGQMAGLPRMGIFMFLGGFFGLNWFINHFRNSALGIVGVFMLTGFLGYAIGPMVNHFLQTGAGTQVVVASMATTGITFLVLSGYVLVTRKDFQFMGGMLMVGIIAAFVLGLANVFFIQMPAISLAVSALFVLLMSGLILYETSDIVHGRQTNYILATTSIFVALYNMFHSLLMIFGIMGDE